MPTRTASAVWEGGLKGGRGRFEGESGELEGAVSFGSRFEEAGGTNPEEMLAAAEASCFSMALAGALEKAGTPPRQIRTEARCTIEPHGDGFKVTTMELVVRADVPGADAETFQEKARATKEGCPVSGALQGNVRLDLDARLE